LSDRNPLARQRDHDRRPGHDGAQHSSEEASNAFFAVYVIDDVLKLTWLVDELVLNFDAVDGMSDHDSDQAGPDACNYVNLCICQLPLFSSII